MPIVSFGPCQPTRRNGSSKKFGTTWLPKILWGFSDSIEGEKGRVYRYRIGDYRVIFDWEGTSILILKVGHRREVYR